MIEVMEACVEGRLDEIRLEFEDQAAVCVVLASDGYPIGYQKAIRSKGWMRLTNGKIIIVFMRVRRKKTAKS
ncbi:hypothetical protein C823_000017 [Eubacterium plexicaudatum ASF492]|nr:hypothetical protein C823_000017 [Eubacterium plexicaudatum ASF492]